MHRIHVCKFWHNLTKPDPQSLPDCTLKHKEHVQQFAMFSLGNLLLPASDTFIIRQELEISILPCHCQYYIKIINIAMEMFIFFHILALCQGIVKTVWEIIDKKSIYSANAVQMMF